MYSVPLDAVSTVESIVPAIAGVVGVAFYGSADPVQLLRALREKTVLLVLDNFEHLLPSALGGNQQALELLANLLHQAPQVKLLVTSRERLKLHGEWVFDVPGLPVPPRTRPTR